MYDGRLYPEKLTKYSQKYPGKYRKMGESHWNISRMTKSPIHPIHGLMLSTEDFDKPTRPRPRNMPPIPQCLRSPFPFLEMIWILGRNSQNLLFFCTIFWAFELSACIKSPWSVTGKYDLLLISSADYLVISDKSSRWCSHGYVHFPDSWESGDKWVPRFWNFPLPVFGITFFPHLPGWGSLDFNKGATSSSSSPSPPPPSSSPPSSLLVSSHLLRVLLLPARNGPDPDRELRRRHIFWHPIWHTFWHPICISGILSGILSGIYSDIQFGILSDILCGMCSGPGAPS